MTVVASKERAWRRDRSFRALVGLMVLAGCHGATEVRGGAAAAAPCESQCMGDYSILPPAHPVCASARRARPHEDGENPRVVRGRIAGAEPGEKIEVLVLNGTLHGDPPDSVSIHDMAFQAPSALQADGLFAVWIGTTPITMVRIEPARHRPVEIVSGADELCVLVELRK
jgi:hypothetical protein